MDVGNFVSKKIKFLQHVNNLPFIIIELLGR